MFSQALTASLALLLTQAGCSSAEMGGASKKASVSPTAPTATQETDSETASPPSSPAPGPAAPATPPSPAAPAVTTGSHLCGNNPAADVVRNKCALAGNDLLAFNTFYAAHPGGNVGLKMTTIAGQPVGDITMASGATLANGGVTLPRAAANALTSMHFDFTLTQALQNPSLALFVCVEGLSGWLPTVSTYVPIPETATSLGLDIGLPADLFQNNPPSQRFAVAGVSTDQYRVAWTLVYTGCESANDSSGSLSLQIPQ